jgi:hypothetical protein
MRLSRSDFGPVLSDPVPRMDFWQRISFAFQVLGSWTSASTHSVQNLDHCSPCRDICLNETAVATIERILEQSVAARFPFPIGTLRYIPGPG